MNPSSPKPRTPIDRDQETTKIRVPFEKTRWRYQQDGRDFGPWSGRQMLEHLWEETLDADSMAYEEWNEKWYRIGSVPEFAQELAQIERDNESRALEQEATNTGKEVRSARKRHWSLAIAGTLSIIAAIAAITLLDADTPHNASSEALNGLYLTLVIPALAQGDFTIESTLQESTSADTTSPRKTKRRKKSGAGRLVPTTGKGAVAYSSGSTEPTLDFTAKATPEEQSRFERRVQKRVQGLASPLGSCANRELNNHGLIRSGKFVFQVSKTGKISEARVVNSGRVSTEFLRCVKSAVKKFKVEPYSGSSIRVDYRLQVGPRSRGETSE